MAAKNIRLLKDFQIIKCLPVKPAGSEYHVLEPRASQLIAEGIAEEIPDEVQGLKPAKKRGKK